LGRDGSDGGDGSGSLLLVLLVEARRVELGGGRGLSLGGGLDVLGLGVVLDGLGSGDGLRSGLDGLGSVLLLGVAVEEEERKKIGEKVSSKVERRKKKRSREDTHEGSGSLLNSPSPPRLNDPNCIPTRPKS